MKKRIMNFMLCIMTVMLCLAFLPTHADAAGTLSLNKKEKKMTVGDTYKLEISGTKKKVKWSSTNTRIVKVSNKGVITAKRKGTATVKAKVGGKTYKCYVTVVLQQDTEADRVIKKINKIRRQYGRVSLKKNDYLMQAAQKRAKEISNKFSAKTRPNGSYWTSAIDMKYNYQANPTENIARECATADSLIALWMSKDNTKSPMLNSNYRDIGVGYYVDSNGRSHWVAIFANR